MKNIKEKMDSVKSKVGSDARLKQGIKTLKDNMKIIRDRILAIQSKLSLVKESPYLSLEDHERLDAVFKQTTQPNKIPGKIEIVKGKLEDLLESREIVPTSEPTQVFNKITNDEKRRVISVMREQTKGIYSLIKETKKNAFQLDALEFVAKSVKHDQEQKNIQPDRYIY